MSKNGTILVIFFSIIAIIFQIIFLINSIGESNKKKRH
jgi:hypothetical protein